MEVDDALALVGGYRRWHLAAFALISFTSLITLASHGMIFVFTGRGSPHHCRVPDDVPLNQSLPLDDATGELSQCSMYVNSSWSNETTTCTDGWAYSPTDGEKTIVMEWDLVCDYSIYSELSQVFYQLGAVLGEVVASLLSDRFGRRWVHVSSYVIIVSCGTGLAFVKSYLAYSILRPVVAFAIGAGINAAFTHLFELFDSSMRSFVGVGAEFFWTVGYMYIALLGWLVKDWRQLQLIISLTSIIGFFNICIVESPMWLLANHRRDEAEEALQKMAKYNGIPVPKKLLQDDDDKGYPLLEGKERDIADGNHHVNNSTTGIQLGTANTNKKCLSEPPEETGQETIWDLFRWPLLCKYTIISTLLWFANNIVYYFLVLSTPTLAGDLDTNFLIGGLVEIPAFILSYFLIIRSRKIPTCVFHILAAVCLVALGFIPPKTASGVDLSYLIITVAMLGKFSITTTFTFIILYTREFFPTNLRGTSSGVVNLLGRAGNMVAPFASYAARSIPWVPNVILGIISFVVAMLTLLLPETKDWPLPQSIADVYRYSRGEHRTRKGEEDIRREAEVKI